MVAITEETRAKESSGPLTGRELQGITDEEIRVFNLDYNRIMDEERSIRSARILEDGRELGFELVRHVMDRANQRYGGSLSSGDEIGIRLIRPDDLEQAVAVATGLADSFQFTWVATANQDIFGTAGNPINLADNATAESILIVGWSTDHPAPKTESIQGTKFTRTLFVQPLPWDLLTDARGGVKVIEANPWFVGFPGETFTFDVNVHTVGADVLRAVGVWITVGTLLRTM